MSRARTGSALVLALTLAACAPASSAVPSESSTPGSTLPSSAGSPNPTASPGADGSVGPPAGTPAPSASAPPLPAFSHIFLIVLENEEDSAIIGNRAAPYLNNLARTYGLATNYHAIGHPSQPNYLALASGSTDGVTDDGNHDLAQESVFDEIDAGGRTWQVAAQDDRTGCFKGATTSGGPDGPGTYARKHNPAISFTSISSNPTRCARIGDFTGFDPGAADFTWIVPNLCNTMHDCSIATGDGWLASFLPTILDSAAYRQGGLVLLTFDEGTTNTGGGGGVATIVISPLARTGFVSAIAHDHYSLLGTIQAAWGMPCLARTCAANDLREFFR